ncbi:DegT/DnrJ/EryC1/StrS aminotransferase family protein [Pusillimonas sp. DMV24BSW_D]|uniref:DegT/DnrJ/EryC1/StrS family aminotransferase n=1 Tax=Neopusillimonas aestuarii TaxID=2716226 RepID=UPI00140E2A2A|nr:DegT/DnrJ/EryC1/StrS aminotransferase family protein [Pusillimonas sp. DMV24BSW_D]QIM48048.1 DegT/DnrJ/EryC1/StrS aminotransferase family protein [Pusillimonas sp. DMV24BSW_D]
MLNTNFSPWPSFTHEEAEAIKNVLLSNKVNYWTGNECKLFEKEFAEWCGTRHAIALANGTVALDLALKALKIGPNDEVIVTPRTFIASASCIVNAGARPVFADVDPNTQNITAQSIQKVLTPRTKAIICVHLAGYPCDMDPIMDLANNRGIYVIEDCAQAHGARYKDRPVGSIGHVAAWSFCQDKIMTTGGEGGMLTTDETELWKTAWAFKDHGKSWDAVHNRQHPPGFRWLHDDFGTNWRMTEIQATIGRIQLQRMPEWTKKRNDNATKLISVLTPFCGTKGLVRLPATPEAETVHAYYKFYFFVRPENFCTGWDRDRLVSEIAAAGVPCYQGSCSEIYLEKAFEKNKIQPTHRLPNAKMLGETSLMLLVHPTLSEEEINLSCEILKERIQVASVTPNSKK